MCCVCSAIHFPNRNHVKVLSGAAVPAAGSAAEFESINALWDQMWADHDPSFPVVSAADVAAAVPQTPAPAVKAK